MQELIKYNNLTAMVAEYNLAQENIKEGFTLLQSAKKHLDTLGGTHVYLFPAGRIDESNVEQPLTYIKQQAWRTLVTKTNIRNLLSEKKNKELNAQLENPKELPDVSVEAIMSFFEHFSSNLTTFLQETIEETFEFLRPHTRWQKDYKTNSEYEIGKKVIKEYMFDTSFGYVNLNYHKENALRSLDNVFHLLDGKGPIKYPGDLITVIHYALQYKQWECATEYFYLKWYKNGNCHIEFKRMDLVAELNKRAGGNRLKGGKL
jgi:hypothetical protein